MKPICLQTYPVTKVQEENFKMEVEHLVLLGVIKEDNDSEWWAPSFAKPKAKSNWVNYLSGFSNLNNS